MENSLMSLINVEINLILTQSANCLVLSSNIPNQAAALSIPDTKLYIPLVTLSTEDNETNFDDLIYYFKDDNSRKRIDGFENETIYNYKKWKV